MRRTLLLIAAAVLLAAAAGCVERQMTLVTDPQDAKVYYNDRYVGRSPVTFHFTYYQSPRIRIEKAGYDTLNAAPPVKPPLYERFPLDLVSEGLIPWTIHDRRTLNYTLVPTAPIDVKALIDRAEELRLETTGQQ